MTMLCRKTIFLCLLIFSLPLFAERAFVNCQNIAVNGGESPKWLTFLFERHNEKRARKELEIESDEEIFFCKVEGENLEMLKTLARQTIYKDANGGDDVGAINALRNVADFWILEKDSEKGLLYTYYTVYAKKAI